MSAVEELKFIWKFLFSDIISPKSTKEIEEEELYAENIKLLKRLMLTENLKFHQKYNAENILEKIKGREDIKYEDISNDYAKKFIQFLKDSFEITAEEIQINEKITVRRNELIKHELNNKLKKLNSNYNLDYIGLNKCLGAELFESQINASLKFNSLKDILSKLVLEMKNTEHQYHNLTEMDKFLDQKISELQNYLNSSEDEHEEEQVETSNQKQEHQKQEHQQQQQQQQLEREREREREEMKSDDGEIEQERMRGDHAVVGADRRMEIQREEHGQEAVIEGFVSKHL